MSSVFPPAPRRVLVTGASGYLGRAMIPALLQRGHRVRALVRATARPKLPTGVEVRTGDVLNPSSVGSALDEIDTVVHLVGVPKPSPTKARLFREIDLVSIQATVTGITAAAARPHLVYLSVAQPASIMRAYVAVRAEGEALVRAAGIRATFVRPWYVLGPGHRWPYLLLPVYALMRCFPPTRDSARRLGLVTLRQMTAALVAAVESSPHDVRIVDVPAIRTASLAGPMLMPPPR